jgi:hypothetical protein
MASPRLSDLLAMLSYACTGGTCETSQKEVQPAHRPEAEVCKVSYANDRFWHVSALPNQG